MLYAIATQRSSLSDPVTFQGVAQQTAHEKFLAAPRALALRREAQKAEENAAKLRAAEEREKTAARSRQMLTKAASGRMLFCESIRMMGAKDYVSTLPYECDAAPGLLLGIDELTRFGWVLVDEKRVMQSNIFGEKGYVVSLAFRKK